MTKYTATKNIRYKAPGERYRELILAGTPEAKGLSMDHLKPAEIKLLEIKGIIRAEKSVPKTKEEK